jgi:dephospho-CoA kinase
VIDADALAREVVEPGTPGYAAVVAQFGPSVVAEGRLDRPALAALVFADDAKRAQLNAIVHPLVGQRMAEVMASLPESAIVVYDVPLLVENGLGGGFETIVVVQAGVPARLARLAERGMTEADARARMAIQATDEQRRAVADILIDNDGSRDELGARVAEVWAQLRARDAAPA